MIFYLDILTTARFSLQTLSDLLSELSITSNSLIFVALEDGTLLASNKVLGDNSTTRNILKTGDKSATCATTYWTSRFAQPSYMVNTCF